MFLLHFNAFFIVFSSFLERFEVASSRFWPCAGDFGRLLPAGAVPPAAGGPLHLRRGEPSALSKSFSRKRMKRVKQS